MAETLISFSRVAPQSSPTPSPAASRNANGVTAHTNAHSELTRGSTARSSSPFADLPIWPPAPASKAAATLSTFPPSRDCYERAAAHQANSQASTGPAPREGMLNRTWYPGVRHTVAFSSYVVLTILAWPISGEHLLLKYSKPYSTFNTSLSVTAMLTLKHRTGRRKSSRSQYRISHRSQCGIGNDS